MSIPISIFTPLLILYLLTTVAAAADVTTLLAAFPDLSDFSNLLSSTAVAADLLQRSSITLLAVPNSFAQSSDLLRRQGPADLADVIRYHVLLEYLSLTDLKKFPPYGKLVTTLFQTTGRATNNFGSVNVTFDPLTGQITILSLSPYPNYNATVLSQVKAVPYNVSILSVNSFLVPYGFDLMTSETRPNLGMNITSVLINGHDFNVAASMLTASGVVQEFENDEGGAGITMFVPTDNAFADLPSSVNFQSLPADKKAVVLKFHVLHSYYPLGSLQSIVNPVQPTLATEDMGAGSFTLNISRVNGSVAINTGIVQASVTQTVFDQNPVAIFGVSRVLLPREIFGKKTEVVGSPPGGGGGGGDATPPAPPPGFSLSPESSPSRLASSSSGGLRSWDLGFLWCIGMILLV